MKHFLLPPFQPSLKSITPISIYLWMLINSYTILLTVNVDFWNLYLYYNTS